ncbi:MAG TPA: 2-phosphosulfolactate phosphatase [Phycisphaerae bacterium]|nr:2-phosphosulfolactate phosphatase [Phycisphaerae bacterium]
MIDVMMTPGELEAVGSLAGAQVVVLDVLRATSTVVSALAAGARGVRLFGSLEEARAGRAAWSASDGPVVLAGESQCLKPADFDLGNSPREMVTEKVGGATVLLATTNGTRAAARARLAGADLLYAGSLLNAGATAERLLEHVDERRTVFLCSGTGGKLALEDVLGAGAILFAMLGRSYRADLPFTDGAWLAYHAYAGVRARVGAALRLGIGGVNVIEAGLEDDIDWCARVDGMGVVAAVDVETLRVTKAEEL